MLTNVLTIDYIFTCFYVMLRDFLWICKAQIFKQI